MMDYEKKYNEALNWMRELYPGLHGATKEDAEHYFPELRESEDERMVREFNDWLCEEIECRTNDLRDEKDRRTLNMLYYVLTKVKDWFEKQKEQKPAEWSEDYREEDIQTRFAFYTYKDDPSVLYLSNVFVEKTSRNHGFGTRILKAAEKVAEAIGAITICLKVKQDSPANAWYRKHGYGYVAFEDGYDWLEKNLEYIKPKKSIKWSGDDELMIESLIAYLKGTGQDFISNDMVYWLKSLPERFNLQTKQEWSEEDEEIFNNIIEKAKGGHWIEVNEITWLINRFKSLRPIVNANSEKVNVNWSEEDEKMRYFVTEAVQSRYSDRELAKYLNPKIIYEKKQLKKKLFDWLRDLRPSWKPSKEQMNYLSAAVIDAKRRNDESTSGFPRYHALKEIYEELLKL